MAVGNIKVSIIGCGKLGKTIGKLFCQTKVAEIIGIVNSSFENAEKSISFIGAGRASSLNAIPASDLYLITTPDDKIAAIANYLSENNILEPGSTVIHCSGSLCSDVLSSTKIQNCKIASIHPIKSFANPKQSANSFAGTLCAVEGDEEAIELISQLFNSIGAHIFNINKENKKMYHAACVMSNNYLVTLHYHAYQCYLKAGIDEAIAKKLVNILIEGALMNLSNNTHINALTGPIQRGDINTIRDHIDFFDNTGMNLDTKNLYQSLGAATLPLTNHTDSKKKELQQALINMKVT